MTIEERGRDVSAAQAEAEAETSTVKKYLKTMSPRYVLSMADGYPVLWLLFWPVRAHQKKNHPEEYAANRAKYKRKK